MKVKVIGKSQVTVSKKTGNEGYWLSVSYKKLGWEGETGEQIYLRPSEYPPELIQIGRHLNVDRDARGMLIDIQLLDD